MVDEVKSRTMLTMFLSTPERLYSYKPIEEHMSIVALCPQYQITRASTLFSRDDSLSTSSKSRMHQGIVYVRIPGCSLLASPLGMLPCLIGV